jgi:hypothetical protein
MPIGLGGGGENFLILIMFSAITIGYPSHLEYFEVQTEQSRTLFKDTLSLVFDHHKSLKRMI